MFSKKFLTMDSDFWLKAHKSKMRPLEEQFTLASSIGEHIYSLLVEINNQMVEIHEYIQRLVFSDIDYYSIIPLVPMWIRHAGHSEESCMDKISFEKRIKANENILTNKLLYYHDLEALTNSVQNRFSIIGKMIDILFLRLNSVFHCTYQDYDEVVFSRDVETHAVLNTIIINVCSCLDILTKLTYELNSITEVSFDKYPKLKSKDILYSYSKRLPLKYRQDGSLFCDSTPVVIRMFESLRNEIVHNGTLDFDYTIYYGKKGEDYDTWIFFPEFDKSGVLASYNARKKFYPDYSKTFNTELPKMVNDFLTISLETLALIKSNITTEYYASPIDVNKFAEEIKNWYKIETNED